MSKDKTIPVSVSAMRADDYSPDGKNVTISLTTTYSTAERKYSVPVECFHDFIMDLQRLNAAASATSIETSIQPAIAPNPADDINRLTMQPKTEWVIAAATETSSASDPAPAAAPMSPALAEEEPASR